MHTTLLNWKKKKQCYQLQTMTAVPLKISKLCTKLKTVPFFYRCGDLGMCK